MVHDRWMTDWLPSQTALMIPLIMKSTLALLLTFLAIAPLAAATQRGPSTAEERARAVELVRLLETEPWSDEAPEARAWLKKFIIEIPDLTIKHCLSLFGSPQERAGIPEWFLFQPTFSSLVYRLENPADSAGSTQTFLSGMEGALRSYAALRDHGSLESVPRLDYLETLRKDGQLESYIRGKARYCK